MIQGMLLKVGLEQNIHVVTCHVRILKIIHVSPSPNIGRGPHIRQSSKIASRFLQECKSRAHILLSKSLGSVQKKKKLSNSISKASCPSDFTFKQLPWTKSSLTVTFRNILEVGKSSGKHPFLLLREQYQRNHVQEARSLRLKYVSTAACAFRNPYCAVKVCYAIWATSQWPPTCDVSDQAQAQESAPIILKLQTTNTGVLP